MIKIKSFLSIAALTAVFFSSATASVIDQRNDNDDVGRKINTVEEQIIEAKEIKISAFTVLCANVHSEEGSLLFFIPKDVVRSLIIPHMFPKTLRPVSVDITDSQFTELCTLNPYIDTVQIGMCNELSSACIRTALQRFPKLNKFSSSRQLSYEDLLSILQGHPCLASLNLKDCSQLTEENIVAALTSGAKKLSVLTLNQPLTDNGLLTIIEACPDVNALSLGDSGLFTDQGLVDTLKRAVNV